MEKYFMTPKSKYDYQHMDKVKVRVSTGFAMHGNPDINITYCSLGGCDILFKPCSEGCPYATRVYARHGTQEYNLQKAIEELGSNLEEEPLLIKFIEDTFTEEEVDKVVEVLSTKCSSSLLEKIKDLNPELIKRAISLINSKDKEWEKARRKRYVEAKIIGEYIYIKISGMPDIRKGTKKYWHSHGVLGSWIKITDIDSHFLACIKHPDFVNKTRENMEEYRDQINALMDFLEKEFQITTLLELADC